ARLSRSKQEECPCSSLRYILPSVRYSFRHECLSADSTARNGIADFKRKLATQDTHRLITNVMQMKSGFDRFRDRLFEDRQAVSGLLAHQSKRGNPLRIHVPDGSLFR